MKRILFIFLMMGCLMLCACGKAEEESVADVVSIEIQDATEDVEVEPFVVCLDPGHGFDDGGCSTELIEEIEADINLDVVNRVKEELEKQGATVLLTHNGTEFPARDVLKAKADELKVEYKERALRDNNIFSAYERSIYAITMHRETPIDFFVSLHVNSNDETPELSQYELYYYEGNEDVPLIEAFSESLAERLDNTLLVAAKNRKIAYTVTCIAEYPSVLIEMGYANNEIDAAKLNSDEWRQEFAEILADEIMLLRK